MNITETVEHNTITLTPGLSSIDITPGIPIPDLSRCEVVINYKMAQSTTDQRNIAVTVQKIAVDKIRLQRGGTGGGVVVGFSIIVYTVDSGIIVEDYSDSLYQNPRPIPITTRDRSHRYSRVTVRCTSDVGFDLMFVTDELLASNDTLNIRGKTQSVSIHIEAQVVYVPDMTVHHFIGTATGISYPVSLSGLGVVTNEAFCILSCRGSGLNPNNIKEANLSSNTQVDIYSYVSKSVYYTLQVCHRSSNLVIRNGSIFSLSFDVVNLIPNVILNRTFVNLPGPYNTFAPTDTSTDDAQHCAIKSILNGVSSITLEKFILGYETKIYSEVVFIDGDSGIDVVALAIAPTAAIAVERLETESTVVASVAAPTANVDVSNGSPEASLDALAIAPTASISVEKLELELTLVASVAAPTAENTVNNENFISMVVPFWAASSYKGG